MFTNLAELRERLSSPRYTLVLLFGLVGLSVFFASHARVATQRENRAVQSLGAMRAATPILTQEVRAAIARGDKATALQTLRYALLIDPDSAEAYTLRGHIQEAAFDFENAQADYEKALACNPQDAEAGENMLLCKRLKREARTIGIPEKTSLYGLHRVMLTWGRIDEALRLTQYLKDDPELLRATWQSAFDQTGMKGHFSVNADDGLDLDASGAPFIDLNFIRRIPLSGLNLSKSSVADLTLLKGMSLQRLNISETEVRDLWPLRGMPLRSLNARDTAVADLTPLTSLRLHELDLTRTNVSDISPLRGLPLRTLRLGETAVKEIYVLATIPLIELNLAHTRVADLRPLSHLPLQILNLENTGIVDLAPLRGSPLTELNLARTAIHDLAPLQRMPLQMVDLRDCNQPLSLHPLAQCGELEHLTLPQRPLGVEALRDLPHLRFLHRVVATDNTLSTATAAEYWATLAARN